MTALDKKDLHVHTPFCPHRHTDAPLEAYLAAAERAGMAEVAFTEHAPLPIPLERTQYGENPNLSADGVDAYFAGMQAFREHYTGPVRMRIGLEVEYFEGCEEKTGRILEAYGPRMEDGLISVHNLLVDGCYLNLDYRHNIIAAVKAVGARKLGEIYYRTLIRSVTADLGPWRPRRVGHPTLLGRCGRLFPEFYDNLPVMEEFILVVKEQECALELNTSGVLYPDDCGQIYGEALLPLIQKHRVPVSLGSDAHEPERIGGGFDLPVIQENLKTLLPVWEA